MKFYPKVSIIITSLNRKKELLKCVKTIYSQKYKNFEIIIIDNGSSDGTSNIIKKKYPKVRLFKTIKNLGTSYSRNAGVSFSKGKIIWFLDSDTYLYDKNTLSSLISKFFQNKKIDVIGGEGVLKNQKIIGAKILKLYSNGMTKSFLIKNIDKIRINVAATSNLIMRKDIFLNVGGFDHYYFFYLEDIDLTYRIFKKGYKMYSFSNMSVLHYFSKKSRFKNHFSAKRNRIYFIMKNFGILNILILPISDLKYLLNYDNLKRFFLKSNIKLNKNYSKKTNVIRNFTFMNLFLLIFDSVVVILSMIYSYIYIPIYLFKFSFYKNKNNNYIKNINKKEFEEIS